MWGGIFVNGMYIRQLRGGLGGCSRPRTASPLRLLHLTFNPDHSHHDCDYWEGEYSSLVYVFSKSNLSIFHPLPSFKQEQEFHVVNTIPSNATIKNKMFGGETNANSHRYVLSLISEVDEVLPLDHTMCLVGWELVPRWPPCPLCSAVDLPSVY